VCVCVCVCVFNFVSLCCHGNFSALTLLVGRQKERPTCKN